MAIAVNVTMFGNFGACKCHGRRIEGITIVELELQLICVAFVEASSSGIDLHNPSKSNRDRSISCLINSAPFRNHLTR